MLLNQFNMKCSGVLLTSQFAYRKCLSTCVALLSVSHTLQSVLESGSETRIVKIYFSADFDRVNDQGILYKLCSVVQGLQIGILGCWDLETD